jgi:hypothetical protein
LSGWHPDRPYLHGGEHHHIAGDISQTPIKSNVHILFSFHCKAHPAWTGVKLSLPHALLIPWYRALVHIKPYSSSRYWQHLVESLCQVVLQNRTSDPCVAYQKLHAMNFILACYAVSLVQGETIHTQCIHHVALLGCLSQAISFHTQCGLLHLHSADIDFIKIITDAVNKHKTVPKHCDMIHDMMFHHMATLLQNYAISHPDYLVVVLCN